ncbi:hypothetical protein QE152_g9056 [Popillia japonica]|uniref:Uncharacterized protein n=1 Tax=Popillia japonica TaxID=7064 RepID=A0AAW1M073_POPJA
MQGKKEETISRRNEQRKDKELKIGQQVYVKPAKYYTQKTKERYRGPDYSKLIQIWETYLQQKQDFQLTGYITPENQKNDQPTTTRRNKNPAIHGNPSAQAEK